MKTILCYGDSNTWGFVPGAFAVRGRYDRKTRWPGRLQQMLGSDKFYVIEEGLNNRTTNVDPNDKPPGYRGTQFLIPILHTHSPVDLVIVMLGINDLKLQFNNRTSEEITRGMKEIIDIIQSTNFGPNPIDPPPVLIVGTPLPVETQCQDVLDMFGDTKGRLTNFSNELQALVRQYPKNVFFVDAAAEIRMSPVDGIHLDDKGHEKIALLLNKTIREILKSA